MDGSANQVVKIERRSLFKRFLVQRVHLCGRALGRAGAGHGSKFDGAGQLVFGARDNAA